MENDKSDILYLFYRPTEPVYMAKGKKRIAFNIPKDYYLADGYGDLLCYLKKRFGPIPSRTIEVKAITPPDTSLLTVGRLEHFSLFIPAHRMQSAELIKIFMDMPTFEEFKSAAVYCREHLNPNMFIYAFGVAILHRPDTKHLSLPPLCQIFPDKYVDARILSKCRQEANIVPEGFRKPIKIPKDYTASDLDHEHRVAYWREDIGINHHHWHWHLVYPLEGDFNIVNKDRRGELFYYMHKQIVARYNCERLCNRLDRVKRFINWRDPIAEGYFPKLSSKVANRNWPSRPSGIILQDIDQPKVNYRFDIQDMERSRDRILAAIHTGYVIDTDNNRIPLTEKNGIDVLGNIMEASMLSINPNVYGDLHNCGHIAIAFCHDPDDRYLELSGIMGDTATAMRDPIFYRWHAFVDSIFQEYKSTLPHYSKAQLDFPGIEMVDISLNNELNELNTFWAESCVDVSKGLDFESPGQLLVKFTHLHHADFTYTIKVHNRKSTARRGTVRIFIAPNKNERGQNFTLREQMNLMIEMDKFSVTLCAGKNTIKRKSKQSSVTIPFEQTFPAITKEKELSISEFNFCGCGWPQHMLVPKGTMEGYPMDLFVMVSDYNGDVIEQDDAPICKDAASYCGLRDRKYPDARAMGYPFDRLANQGVNNLEDFCKLTRNMKAVKITVKFTDTTVSMTKCPKKENTSTVA